MTDSQSLDRLSIQTQDDDLHLRPRGRVADWAKDVDNLLSDKYGLYKFTEFLRQEFSHENIYFWCACEKFRLLERDEERLQAARNILARHLEPGAVDPVNIDAATSLKLVTDRLGDCPDADTFLSAQTQIYNLMRFDSYPRFLKSSLYTDCVRREMTGASLNDCELISLDEESQAAAARLEGNLSTSVRYRKNKDKEKNRLSIFWDTWGRKDGEERIEAEAREKGDCTLTRVILPNGATSVVNTTSGESIRSLVSRLLEKRGLRLTSFEVFTTAGDKQLDVSEDCDILGCTEVRVEQRVSFKLEIPGHRTLGVKAKLYKRVREVVSPLLRQYNWELEDTTLVLEDGTALDMDEDTSIIDNKRVLVRKSGEESTPQPKDPEMTLYEGLQIMRKGRLEDQRGTEISFEIPDFLKISSQHNNGSAHSSSLPRHRNSSLPRSNGSSYAEDQAAIQAGGGQPVSMPAHAHCRKQESNHHVNLVAREEFDDSSPTLGFV